MRKREQERSMERMIKRENKGKKGEKRVRENEGNKRV